MRGSGAAAALTGAILFDLERLRQAGLKAADPGWFDPASWGEHARPVGSGGRGGAWFIDAEAGGVPLGAMVLRHICVAVSPRNSAATASSGRGAERARSFAEFRLLREALRRKLPVPRPIAAIYWREGLRYRAGILLERLCGVSSLADLAAGRGGDAPWDLAGQLIARMHRAGLDHADLNAHNLLFDEAGRAWIIDLDRGQWRIPATAWRDRNLARLQRSLLKLRGTRDVAEVERDYARLRSAYDAHWQRGT